VTSGCSGALELMFGVLADPGDVILLPRPGFTLYATICQSKGIQAQYYPLHPDNSWEIDLSAVRQIFHEQQQQGKGRIAAWLINNPSNPCGSVYSEAHLKACVQLADEFQIPVIADEIYEDMVWGEESFTPLRTIDSQVPILTCSGLAKRFLVPGWRLGWILMSDRGTPALGNVREGLNRLAAVLLGANSLIQAAIPDILALTPASFYAETNAKLQENGRIAAAGLQGIPGVSYVEPQGAMYMMVGFDMSLFESFSDDVRLGELLISEESVLCLPGSVRLMVFILSLLTLYRFLGCLIICGL